MELNEFSQRLSKLRIAKKVSAREMSLSIGQSAGYINNIENGVNFPSMQIFLYICDYLGITPSEFFDYTNNDPQCLSELTSTAKKLNSEELSLLYELANRLSKKR